MSNKYELQLGELKEGTVVVVKITDPHYYDEASVKEATDRVTKAVEATGIKNVSVLVTPPEVELNMFYADYKEVAKLREELDKVKLSLKTHLERI